MLFSILLCRSLYVTYQKPVDLDGIHLYRYTCPPSVLADHETNPDNACYCTNTTGCLGTGVIDISACKQGMSISSPSIKFIVVNIFGHLTSAVHHNTYSTQFKTYKTIHHFSNSLQSTFCHGYAENMNKFFQL